MTKIVLSFAVARIIQLLLYFHNKEKVYIGSKSIDVVCYSYVHGSSACAHIEVRNMLAL